MQTYFYPDNPESSTNDWTAELAGDMRGCRYKFSLMLATRGSTSTLLAEIIVQQGGVETVLAEAEFTTSSQTYRRFDKTVDGPDPMTSAGDTLLLRVTATEGDPAGLLAKAPDSDTHILVPCH